MHASKKENVLGKGLEGAAVVSSKEVGLKGEKGGSQLQSGVELCGDYVDGVRIVATAELLLPPGMAHSDRLDSVIGSNHVGQLNLGSRSSNPHIVAAGVVACGNGFTIAPTCPVM